MFSNETGKQRSQRIELDYFRQRGKLAKSKGVIAALAGIFGVAAIAYSSVDNSVANPGLVTAAHAKIESNCADCHTPFSPISNDAIRNLSLPPFVNIEHQKSIDNTQKKCSACHDGNDASIANPHYRHKMTGDWSVVDKNCVLCHADHKGRDFDLTLVDDSNCVACHGKLPEVCDASQQVVQISRPSITGFNMQEHGDFQSLGSQDPGRVKFDHAQHLLPGQSAAGAQGKDAMKFDKLPDEFRDKYQSTADGLVQLDCSSCHEPSNAPSNGGSPASDAELGRYMTPVSFDQHCVACHQLNPAGRAKDAPPIAHAAPWNETEKLIESQLLNKLTQSPRQDINPTNLGAINNRPAGAVTADEAERQRQALRLVAAVDKATLMATIRQQCSTCHEDDVTTDDAIATAKAKPMIPDRWFRFGIFDHSAHLTVKCEQCHSGAYGGDPKAPPTDHSRVMIGGIETCTSCHRPEGSPPGNPALTIQAGEQQWASDRCVMCHRYHPSQESVAPPKAVAFAEPAG